MDKYTNKGKRVNAKQYKKLATDMTDDEIKLLNEKIEYLKKFDIKLTYHSINKMKQLDIKRKMISSLISNSRIIEFNCTPHDRKDIYDSRVLLRSTDYFKLKNDKSYQLCAVISLQTNRVITLYWAQRDFNYDINKLDKERYDSNLDITKFL